MGKGDRRTAKGKRFKASYGNSRPHKVKAPVRPVAAPKKEKAPEVETPEVKKEAVKKAPVKKTPVKKAPAKKAAAPKDKPAE